MAHYAFLNDAGTVTEVIAGNDSPADWETYYASVRGQRCKRTSYNTLAGVHATGGTPFRGNYAGIGYVYHDDLDIFAPPCPGEGWALDPETATWLNNTGGI